MECVKDVSSQAPAVSGGCDGARGLSTKVGGLKGGEGGLF